MNAAAAAVLAMAVFACAGVSAARADGDGLEGASGDALMHAVHARHQQYPYVFEQQVMVLEDRHGKRDTRRLRRYTRKEDDGTVRFLLLFDAPSDVLGVALMATRDPDGGTRQYFYLPALGGRLLEGANGDRDSDGHFLGTDFTVESLTGEVLDDYRYVRQADAEIGDARYFRVDVHPAGADPVGVPLRQHFISQETLFIARTDYLDERGRVHRRQTVHDLVPVGGGVWRPNLIRMENLRDGHRSLLRIERRVFSQDYVPEEIFTHEWILANQPPLLALPAVSAEDEP